MCGLQTGGLWKKEDQAGETSRLLKGVLSIRLLSLEEAATACEDRVESLSFISICRGSAMAPSFTLSPALVLEPGPASQELPAFLLLCPDF